MNLNEDKDPHSKQEKIRTMCCDSKQINLENTCYGQNEVTYLKHTIFGSFWKLLYLKEFYARVFCPLIPSISFREGVCTTFRPCSFLSHWDAWWNFSLELKKFPYSHFETKLFPKYICPWANNSSWNFTYVIFILDFQGSGDWFPDLTNDFRCQVWLLEKINSFIPKIELNILHLVLNFLYDP